MSEQEEAPNRPKYLTLAFICLYTQSHIPTTNPDSFILISVDMHLNYLFNHTHTHKKSQNKLCSLLKN